MINLNKVKYLADVLYGYGHRGEPKEKANIFKTSEGDYVVSWKEDGFLKQEYLNAEEYNALISERDQKNQTREYVYESTLEDERKELERQKSEERKQKRILSDAQEEKDRFLAANLREIVKELNHGYQQIQSYNDGYVKKVIRDYEQLEIALNAIKTSSVKTAVLKDLLMARNNFNGTTSMINAMTFVEHLRKRVEENPEHYQSTDLKRAQKEAKKRFNEMTATEKIRYTKERASLNSKTAAELDCLFQKSTMPKIEEVTVRTFEEIPKENQQNLAQSNAQISKEQLENLTLEQLEDLKNGKVMSVTAETKESKTL